jgi:competence protein ComEC
VLWPPPRGATPGNEASIALLVEPATPCGCLSALLLGDLGETAQLRMLGGERVPAVDVVKVSHHGSADQAASLYARADAAVGLIGVGAGNDYGHPTDELLGMLAAAGTVPLRTDRQGLILLSPGDDPGEVEVWTGR